MTTALLFCYGSLLILSSLNRTLGRCLTEADAETCEIDGIRRCWRFATNCKFLDDSQEPVKCVFLDLQWNDGGSCNGILVPVSRTELEILDRRETGYERVAVSEHFPRRTLPVFTYFSLPAYRVSSEQKDSSVVAEKYVELVWTGAAHWGGVFMRTFELNTPKIDFNLRQGEYRFCNLDQQNALNRQG